MKNCPYRKKHKIGQDQETDRLVLSPSTCILVLTTFETHLANSIEIESFSF